MFFFLAGLKDESFYKLISIEHKRHPAIAKYGSAAELLLVLICIAQGLEYGLVFAEDHIYRNAYRVAIVVDLDHL